jgi:alpha-methylacyl-CoA racemase
VPDWDEAPAHAHNVARGTYFTLGGVLQLAPAPRFSRTGSDTPRACESASLDDVLQAWGVAAVVRG